jgi:hypothetical protein
MNLSDKLKPRRTSWSRKTREDTMNLDILSLKEVDSIQQWLDKIEESIKSQERNPVEEENRLLQSINRYRTHLSVRKSRKHA